MTDCYQDLAVILEQLQQMATELIRLSKSECQALKDNDVATLKGTLETEEESATRMQQLERERQEVQQRIEAQLQVSHVTFNQILEQAGPIAARLREAGRELARELAELQELTETKQLLIRQSLSFESELFKALAGVQQGYNSRGEKVSGPIGAAEAINRSV